LGCAYYFGVYWADLLPYSNGWQTCQGNSFLDEENLKKMMNETFPCTSNPWVLTCIPPLRIVITESMAGGQS
jgi:hypothetical protein